MMETFYEYTNHIGYPFKFSKFNPGKIYKINRCVELRRDKIVRQFEEIVNYYPETEEYIRGFLAGFYDAEGSWSKNILRIHNYDKELLNKVKKYLKYYKFVFKEERGGIRITGGLNEAIKFISLIQPKVLHKSMGYKGIKVNNRTTILSIEPYGEEEVYNLETRTNNFIAEGFITHNCARQFTDMTYEPMKLTDFKKIMKKLPWCRLVRIGVQGEPLIYPGNFDIMKYLCKIHNIVTITTNASVLTKKIIDKIPSCVKTIYASVDASTPEVYSTYREGGDIEKWYEGVKLLRKLRPEINVQINYLLFKNNLYDIPRMIDFCAKYKMSLSSTFPVIFTEEFSKEHDAFWLSNLSQVIEYNRKYAQTRRVPYICSTGKIEWRRCDLPWNQPLIGIQGDVYTDFFIYQPRNYDRNKPIIWREYFKEEYNEVPQHQYIMGNIFDQDWKSIWKKKYIPFLNNLVKINSLQYTSKDFFRVKEETDTSNIWDFCKICGRRWGFSY